MYFLYHYIGGLGSNRCGSPAGVSTTSLYLEVQEFDRWLASQRKRVEADLNLSLKDIPDLRMWQKFYFMGTTWIAEKFTIHLSADGHKPTVTGSFISCPL